MGEISDAYDNGAYSRIQRWKPADIRPNYKDPKLTEAWNKGYAEAASFHQGQKGLLLKRKGVAPSARKMVRKRND